MNYITIDVNKKFLVVCLLLLTYAGSVVGAYRIGFSRGATAAMEYMIEVLQGKPKGLDNSAS